MLKFLREHANSWIMKILLGILILSFGLFWGVSEFFRGSDKANVVASIGKIEISKQHLMHSVQEELGKLNRELKGKSVSFSQALSLGLVSQNLLRMINEIVLDMFMKDVKLSVSDKTIASLIYADPLFQDAHGSFDRAKFQNILKANGITEKSFFDNRRRALSQMHLLTAVTAGAYSPAAMAYPVFQSLTQKCSFQVVTILPEKIKVSYTEQELRAFYDQHPDRFKIPEYRDFKLILLDPNKIGMKVSVSEKEIQQSYNDQKEMYVTPETRSFSLVVCKDQEEAAQLRKHILDNSLSKERVETHESVVEANLDKQLGKIIFGLKNGQVSEPLQWKKQLILIKVNKIVPSTSKSLYEVRAQIMEDLKRQKAVEEISKITALIEEGTNQGLSLSEIAQKYKLPIHSGRIDATGDFVQDASISLEADIVKDIFSLPEGGETQLTELPDEVSYLVSVTKIFPQHLEEFEKVRSQIVTELIGEKKQKEMMRIAEIVKGQIQKGEKIHHDAIHATNTPKVSVMEGANKIQLPPSVIHRGFSLAKGNPDIVIDRGKFYVVVPLTIETIPIEKNLGLYKGYKEDLGKSLFQSMYLGFLEALKKEYKVKTYPDVLSSLKE